MTLALALNFDAASMRRDGVVVLSDLTWSVRPSERWVVLGPNGSGKTSLVMLCSGYAHPASGRVEVLGQRLGRVDVRRLRRRIGLVSASVARMLRPAVTALEVVVSGRHAALETWWHDYTQADTERARQLLDAADLAHLAHRAFGVLSEGERQQVQLARALMGEPDLVLLDEPCAGLDVGARERLVSRLSAVAADPATPPIVFVTHHVEDIPRGFTHALLLRAARAVAMGPIAEALTSESLSACFDMALELRHDDGRYTCRAQA